MRTSPLVRSVLVCARDASSPRPCPDRSSSRSQSDPTSVATVTADVSVPAAVERLVTDALERFSRIDVLVNNAGVSGPMGPTEDVVWDEWEQTVRVNLFGSVLSCRALLPHFRANGYGKIIQLSGGGATSPRPRLSAYAASKAAVVRFAETLAEEVRGTGIDVNAIAPGALNTRMLDEVIEAGPERVGHSYYERAIEQRVSGGTPLDLRRAPCRVSRLGRQRRHHGKALQRSVGPVGSGRCLQGRPRYDGRLHATPDRSR